MHTLQEIALFIALVLFVLDLYDGLSAVKAIDKNKFKVSIWVTLFTWIYVPTALTAVIVSLVLSR